MSSIRGLQKTTLIDFPGRIACTIFFSGCNFRCPFCHNKDLVLENNKLPRFSEKQILKFLRSRAGVLEGVVLTGGEPLLYKNLEEFIKKIKNLGFLVKLDTNGELFLLLKKIVDKKLVDYVAMDFKAPIKRYEKTVGVRVNKKAILKSMEFFISGNIEYEFRTTVVPRAYQEKDLIQMARRLKNLVSRHQTPNTRRQLNWYLQQFKPGRCLDEKFNKTTSYPNSFYGKILPKLKAIIPNTSIRGIKIIRVNS